ncbi:ribonuclease X25 isoform X2 [Lycorma delicatula]|uniref:ribonuclease X25 isoform X2 n=1 Tax=Lycorma delicatula TaxID=130591 RepID=UPI003F5184D2
MNRAVNRNERNINVCTVLIAATLLLLCSITLISRIQKLNTDQEWDILLFVQRWPNTACMEWEEKDGKNCTLPKKSGHWTIHGVWPTKLGTKGPTFCNGSLPFNDTALDDIKDDLNEYWTDVELGGKHKKDGFWRHEWVKHGTCASALETLNSEEKYFKQALAWLNDYNMMQVLMFEQIHPTKTAVGYDAVSIAKAVNDAVGKNPFIHCVHDTLREVK